MLFSYFDLSKSNFKTPIFVLLILDVEDYDYQLKKLMVDSKEPVTMIPSSILSVKEFYARLTVYHSAFNHYQTNLNLVSIRSRYRNIQGNIGTFFFTVFKLFP